MSAQLEGRIDIRLHRHTGAVEIASTRPQLAQKLMAGRGPAEAADLAGLIFSLCGKAQKVAAQAACEAAQGFSPDAATQAARRQQVLIELAREHAWRLLLSWPQQADPALGLAPDMASLLALRQAAGAPEKFAETLAHQLGTVFLGEPPQRWLARELPAFEAWCRAGATLPARLFASLWDGLDEGPNLGPDLGVSACPLLPSLNAMSPSAALDLGTLALADSAFCARPTWQGAPAETGALNRVAAHPLLAAWIETRGRGAGARLLARLLELARLPARLGGAHDPAEPAVVRAWRLGENAGLAGVETSRGLLLHGVRLDQGRVADYRIVAPTEWNFHPAGALAQSLPTLAPGPDLEARVRLVSQALDPCVAFGVELLEK